MESPLYSECADTSVHFAHHHFVPGQCRHIDPLQILLHRYQLVTLCLPTLQAKTISASKYIQMEIDGE